MSLDQSRTFAHRCLTAYVDLWVSVSASLQRCGPLIPCFAVQGLGVAHTKYSSYSSKSGDGTLFSRSRHCRRTSTWPFIMSSGYTSADEKAVGSITALSYLALVRRIL